MVLMIKGMPGSPLKNYSFHEVFTDGCLPAATNWSPSGALRVVGLVLQYRSPVRLQAASWRFQVCSMVS